MRCRLGSLALVAVALASSAGCGDEPAPASAPARPAGPIADAVEKTRAAGRARVFGAAIVRDGSRSVGLSLTGAVDFVAQRSRMRADLSDRPDGAVLDRYPNTQIRDGTMSYLSAPGLRARLGRRWARYDLRRIIGAQAGAARVDADAVAFGWTDPQDVLRFLLAAGDPRAASARMEGGDDITVYAATVAPARALELMAPDDAAARAKIAPLLLFAGERVPVEVGIDDASRIRSVKIDAARTTLLLSFSHDGAQAPIPLPPGRDVHDVTDEALAEQYLLAPA